MWECFLFNWGFTILLAVLLAFSELLDEIPWIKANSIHKLINNLLYVLVKRTKKEK